MIIGTAVVELYLPGVDSLKEKRRILKSLLAKTRNVFNVSIAEVGYNDNHRQAQVGIAVVSNDQKFADQVIAKVIRTIDAQPDMSMTDYRVEFL